MEIPNTEDFVQKHYEIHNNARKQGKRSYVMSKDYLFSNLLIYV
jgi:hypothetical protein